MHKKLIMDIHSISHYFKKSQTHKEMAFSLCWFNYEISCLKTIITNTFKNTTNIMQNWKFLSYYMLNMLARPSCNINPIVNMCCNVELLDSFVLKIITVYKTSIQDWGFVTLMYYY